MTKPLIRFFLPLFLLLASLVGMGQKTDKVYLKNGDVITGEIKNMRFGKLGFDMTGPGTIQVKWEEVVRVVSNKKMQITLGSGEIYISSFDSIFVRANKKNLDDLVDIVPIKDLFLQSLDGDINVGFNYAKSNKNLQFNLNSTTTFRRPKTEANLKLNSVISGNTQDTVVSKKQDLTMDVYRRLKKRYYLNGLLGWQQNTELGLRNRFILSGSLGKVFVSDNHQRLLTGGGISYNIEQSNLVSSYQGNVDAIVIVQYKKFNYSSPKISVDLQYIVYPGLSDWGRIRMDFQMKTKVELMKDFFVGLIFYDIYDNKPLYGAVSTNDFGVNFTIGYSFGK